MKVLQDALIFSIILIVGIFGYLEINLSAKILGVLLILEVAILLIFDFAVLIHTDFTTTSFAAFFPEKIISPGAGIAIMFAFLCFVGFESTTLYGEEAKNPHKTIPKATYIAIILIGSFYTLTTWCIGLAYADVDVQAQANTNMINFVFDANTRYVGEFSTSLMQVFFITSIFAVLLAFHNALCRYLFSLGRSGFLAKSLSDIHPKYQSPHKASIILTSFSALVLFIFIINGADPVENIFMWMVSLGVLAVLILQALGSASVISYFYQNKQGSTWEGLIAPFIGCMGLSATVVLAVTHFSLLSGAETGFATHLPWFIPIVVIIAILNGKRQNVATNTFTQEA